MQPCDSCRCATVTQPYPVIEGRYKALGLLAIVSESPISGEAMGRSLFTGPVGELLEATLRAASAGARRPLPDDIWDAVGVFYALSRPVIANRNPAIADIRACHPRLIAELDKAFPSAVLSLGPAACASLLGAGGDKIVTTPITRERGTMRWLNLPSVRVPWIASIAPLSVFKKSDYYRDLSYDAWKIRAQDAPLPQPVLRRLPLA